MKSLTTENPTPDFKLSKGTTGCIKCGTVIFTPDNVISVDFLRVHYGHPIRMRLNTRILSTNGKEKLENIAVINKGGK